MKTINTFIFGFMLFLVLLTMACKGSSKTPPRDRCAEPTVSECLDTDVADTCPSDSFIDTCHTLFQAENLSPTVSQALVPELEGAHNRDREIKGVIHDDQPPLYIPPDDTPATFSLRSARNTLVNINDKLLVDDSLGHSDLFKALDDSFEMSPDIDALIPRSKTKAIEIQPAIINPNSQYLFDGLSYTQTHVFNLLDALYVGKITQWNDNAAQIESCEEYVYERYYGFTLFKDFATLHFDDPLRVAEYAFQGAYLDEDGIHILNSQDIKPGAIGSRNLRYAMGSKDIIAKKGTAVIPDPFMLFAEHTGDYDFMDSAHYTLDFNYMNWVTSPSRTMMLWDGDIVDETVLRYSSEAVDCAQVPTGNCGPTSDDLIPKNFFLETLGKINRENSSVSNGIVLNEPSLIAVYSQPDFDDAATANGGKGYINNWSYHMVMLEAAKRVMPSAALRKKKLLEFKLLRKHLIDLLAERAYFEGKIPRDFIHLRHTYNILKNSETLSLSEKDYALHKLAEFNSGHLAEASTGLSFSPVLTSYAARCSELDAQIEAVLLAAKEKGCLETDTDPALHHYPTENNDPIYHYGAAWSIAEMPDWLEDHAYDLSYDKVFCDWSPEKLVDAALTLIPGEVLDKSYSQCQRITGGDFAHMAPDAYTFTFPTDCADLNQFNIWQPNQPVDYTQDTNQFDKFQKLIELYPKALCDCDAIIEGMVKQELESHGMNYYDPVTQKVMMSKSSSFYNSFGGNYAGLRYGYALGWLYEGYDTISDITTNNADNTLDRSFVCSDTHYFAFGNYFVEGSFLTHDFTLCSAGSYASNKTTGTTRPEPPTLSHQDLQDHIIQDMADVADNENVPLTSFMFIKNEKMTYTYDEANGLQVDEVNVSHAVVYNPTSHQINYDNEAVSDVQMLSVSMQRNVPVCGIISITVKGSITGDIDADSFLSGDNAQTFETGRCKAMNFNFTPRIDFDGFASAAVTAGIAGVASVSAGVDIGLKFVGIKFPYETELFLSERNLMVDEDPDREFNYDIHSNVYSSLDSQLTILSGYFGVFVEVEYVIDSTTYRQTLFSWDGFKTTGNLDRTGELSDGEKNHVKLPVRALYGLAHKLYQ